MTEQDRLTLARTWVLRLRRMANGKGRLERQKLRDIAEGLDRALMAPIPIYPPTTDKEPDA